MRGFTENISNDFKIDQMSLKRSNEFEKDRMS
jgi:hypothetical protein